MNSKEANNVTAESLLTLRQESDALRLITEKLRVKEMGPADHIRTKHEVKAFIDAGDTETAAKLIAAANARVSNQQTVSESISQRQAPRQRL
jgi:hypothetical protein